MEAYSTTSSSLSVSLTILQNTVFFIVKTIHSVHIHICVLSGEGPLDLKKKKSFIRQNDLYRYCTYIYTVHLEKSIYYVAKVIYTGTGTCTVIQTYSKHAYIELML